MLRFHYLVTQYSGNAVYAMTFKSFEGTILQLMRQHLILAPDLPKSVKLHESLARALEMRDAEASAQCARLCIFARYQRAEKAFYWTGFSFALCFGAARPTGRAARLTGCGALLSFCKRVSL